MRSTDALDERRIVILGMLAGTLLSGALGFLIGSTYVTVFMPFAELEAIGPPFLGGLLGMILGGWIGYRGAHALAHQRRRRLVMGVLVILVLLSCVVVRYAMAMLGR